MHACKFIWMWGWYLLGKFQCWKCLKDGSVSHSIANSSVLPMHACTFTWMQGWGLIGEIQMHACTFIWMSVWYTLSASFSGKNVKDGSASYSNSSMLPMYACTFIWMWGLYPISKFQHRKCQGWLSLTFYLKYVANACLYINTNGGGYLNYISNFQWFSLTF